MSEVSEMMTDAWDEYDAAEGADRHADETDASRSENDVGASEHGEPDDLVVAGGAVGTTPSAGAGTPGTIRVPPERPPVGTASAATGTAPAPGRGSPAETAAPADAGEREETFVISVTMKVRYEAAGAAQLPASLLIAGAPCRAGTAGGTQTPAVAHRVSLAEPAAVVTALLALPQEYAAREAARVAQEKAAAQAKKAADAAQKAQARKEADEARRRNALIARAREAGIQVADATTATPTTARTAGATAPPPSAASPSTQPSVPPVMPARPAVAATPAAAVQPAAVAAPPQAAPPTPRPSAPPPTAPPVPPVRPMPLAPASAITLPAASAPGDAATETPASCGPAPLQRSLFQ